MFSVATEVAAGRVGVTTSDNGGLTNAQISEMAINKIISISNCHFTLVRQRWVLQLLRILLRKK